MKELTLMVVLALVSFSASAQVMNYSLCTLNEGKTIADVQAWMKDWRTMVQQAGKQYESRILIPHASPEKENEFYLEGSSPTLATYADAWEWWYTAPQAAKSLAQLQSAASCGQAAVYRTAE
jgi:hypothetical protein